VISKIYRLKEREVKKVLKIWKPFFSYTLVFNVLPNTLSHGRFAIIISGKSVKNAVVRNKYRRLYYETCRPYIDTIPKDISCVVKTKTQLENNDTALKNFKKELIYLFDKKLWKNT